MDIVKFFFIDKSWNEIEKILEQEKVLKLAKQNIVSKIKINMVHKQRQDNLDGLLPGGKVSNWIFKDIKIEDGSVAVVLSLPCKSYVGSGQIDTKPS